MHNRENIRGKDRIVTLPNAMSLFRILLIPLFALTYCVKEDVFLTFGILLVSGITDVLDGYIARRFDMVTHLGKVLDPIADKLTQGVALFCLGGKFPILFLLIGILIIKESVTAMMYTVVVKKTGKVNGALWYGKLATVILYVTMLVHLLWENIPVMISWGLVGISGCMMILSFVLYFYRNLSELKDRKYEKDNGEIKIE